MFVTLLNLALSINSNLLIINESRTGVSNLWPVGPTWHIEDTCQPPSSYLATTLPITLAAAAGDSGVPLPPIGYLLCASPQGQGSTAEHNAAWGARGACTAGIPAVERMRVGAEAPV